MNPRIPGLPMLACAAIFGLAACAPQEVPPTVDVVGTVAAQLAFGMQTQTAGAVTSTPVPPPDTPTPSVTDTPTSAPTSSEPPERPRINQFTGCYYGPGLEYGLDSNIAEKKRVDIVGIGSVPGWYVIVNPYFHKQCWVAAEALTIDPNMDLSNLPVMTPAP